MNRLTYTDKISGMSVPSKLKYDKNMNPILNEDFIKIIKKLAYYEDLEERISSIYEDITIEMIVGEIEEGE